MKFTRISFLFVLILLCVPSAALAQSSASKSWNSFWTSFVATVRSKGHSGIQKLMAPKVQFSDGEVSPNTAVQYLDNANGELWVQVRKSVATGTKPYRSSGGKPMRVTGNNLLVFEREKNGQWKWAGFMGD